MRTREEPDRPRLLLDALRLDPRMVSIEEIGDPARKGEDKGERDARRGADCDRSGSLVGQRHPPDVGGAARGSHDGAPTGRSLELRGECERPSLKSCKGGKVAEAAAAAEARLALSKSSVSEGFRAVSSSMYACERAVRNNSSSSSFDSVAWRRLKCSLEAPEFRLRRAKFPSITLSTPTVGDRRAGRSKSGVRFDHSTALWRGEMRVNSLARMATDGP